MTLSPSSPPMRGDLAAHRRPFTVRRLRPALTAAAAVAIFGAGVGADRVLWQGGEIVGAASSFTESEEFAVLEQTWDLIHNEYADPAAVDDGALVYGAAEGMVDALGDDGHSRFLDPEAATDFEAATRGEFTGIGVEIDIPGDRPIVVVPIDGSPAAEAGVRSGDTILAIDGQTTERLEQEEIGDLIRGDAGTPVTLTLLHRGELTPYEVTMVRRTITLRPVTWRMLPGGVAQVRLAEFSVGATKELEEALVAARAHGATGVVLDLRDNPGGLVAEAVGVASQFMPEGRTIFRQQEREGEAKPLATVGTDGQWVDRPLVVLVNNGSASAAEIVGAALRDNGRATLLGETTYGTGTVLIPFEQPDGSVVLLGTALWLTADGDQIWRKGVVPDRSVRLPASATASRPSSDGEVTADEFAASEDAQLREAVVELTGVALPGRLPAPPALR